MKLLFLGASNTDCGHCFSEDNLGYGYVKMVHDLLLQEAQKDSSSEISLSTSDCSVQIKADRSGTPGNLPKGICTSTIIINGGTDGFTFPRILRKWEQNWKRTAFDAVFILGGINEVGALMDSGMDETSHRELLQHSADALSELLVGLSDSGCPQIFVLEPFLFDTPQYLKSWMSTLEEVREMIRQTVPVCLNRLNFNILQMQTVKKHPCRIHLLPTQPLLDDAIQRSGISEITKDGIHLTQEGHHVLAEMIVKSIRSTYDTQQS